MEELLTYEQAGKKLGTSKWFISTQIRKGALKVTRLGTRSVFRIRESDLQAFVDAKSRVRS